MIQLRNYICFVFCLFFISVNKNHAQIILPQIIGNDMVLQNNAPVPIWGKATNGEKIIVSFAGQTKQVTADASGNWKVVLDKLKIYSSPRDLIIKGDKDKNTIILHNVLVGEVWLCSTI